MRDDHHGGEEVALAKPTTSWAQHLNAVLAILVVAAFLLGIVVGGMQDPRRDSRPPATVKKQQERTDPPVGVSIVTDGKMFRFVGPDKYQRGVFDYPTYQAAVTAAWDYHDFKAREDTTKWVPAER